MEPSTVRSLTANSRGISILRHRTSCSLTHRIPSSRTYSAICTSPPLLRNSSCTARIQFLSCRAYHPQERDRPPPFSSTESAILSSALSHVPTHGFSNTALANGARDAGYLDVSVNLFPRGAFDLIIYHLVTQRRALKHTVQFPEAKHLGIGAKVRSLALHRLRANQSTIRHWQKALAIMAQPSYVSASLQELFLLSDEIWHLAGDSAVDSSWYTKRASLSAIYSSAEVFMSTDTSPEFSETENFLDRRLDELRIVGQTLGAVSEWANFSAGALINVLRSKGVKI